ncbi:MAG TPA: LPS export ABC transporter periplasmic protein LptC [Gemmatimonadaceae bacterium]|jgi:LPS export ABC transporter protein LptC
MRRLAMIVAALCVAGCNRQGSAPPVKLHVSLADSAEQVLSNIHTLLTDHGVERGELFADSAYVFDESTRFELRTVRATFNTTTGVKDGDMRADRGRYNIRQQVLEGHGNVVITTTEGKRLTSPRLRYNQAMNEVSSDTSFTMVEPGRTLSGIGFRADPQLNHVTVLKAPRGQGSFTLPGQ